MSQHTMANLLLRLLVQPACEKSCCLQLSDNDFAQLLQQQVTGYDTLRIANTGNCLITDDVMLIKPNYQQVVYVADNKIPRVEFPHYFIDTIIRQTDGKTLCLLVSAATALILLIHAPALNNTAISDKVISCYRRIRHLSIPPNLSASAVCYADTLDTPQRGVVINQFAFLVSAAEVAQCHDVDALFNLAMT